LIRDDGAADLDSGGFCRWIEKGADAARSSKVRTTGQAHTLSQAIKNFYLFEKPQTWVGSNMLQKILVMTLN
jgi:hypothetical protein